MDGAASVPAAPVSERLRSLDGLRGLAAFVVLVGHCLMLVPAIATAYSGPPPPHVALAVWLPTYTPLHALWAGSEAVVVFFVLSGFVLTRMAEARSFAWRAYYPSRLLRLYLPVVGALLVAAALVEVVHRRPAAGDSWWLDQWASAGPASFAHEAVLLRGAGSLVPPLWSLKWEVLFSLLLPLAVYGASRRRSVAVAQVALLLAATLAGADAQGRSGYAFFLPMFAVGAVLARNRDRLARVGERLGPRAGAALLAAAVVLLTAKWTLQYRFVTASRPLEVAGAAAIVFCFGYWRPARALGESRPLQWLGRRSFSLYLVHFPVVVSAAFLLGGNSRYAFAVAIPLALLAADLFFRAWEGPSHRLSQLVRGVCAPAPPSRPRPEAVARRAPDGAATTIT